MRACIERVEPNRVSGWAYSDNAPDERLSVSLMVDGQVVAETRAGNYREDLKSNGLGDGCYGYIFADVQVADIPAAFISGRVEVRAAANSQSFVLASPASYLRREVEFFFRRQSLESTSLIEFLSTVPTPASLDSESAGQCLDLLNASRAHFTDWLSSSDFLTLAFDLATKANRPYSQRFYRNALTCLTESSHLTPKYAPPVEAEPLPETYGSLREWSESRADLNIKLVEPRFFAGGRPGSFLNEAGILKDGPSAAAPVQVLAYREDCFGEPSWWVTTQGKKIRAARNLYYLDFELLRSVIDERGFVLIDMSSEGPPADSKWIAVLNNAIRELRIEPKQVILITQNLRFGMGMTEDKFLGHIAVGHFYLSKAIKLLKQEKTTESEIARHCHSILSDRKKLADSSLRHYICLNFTPRWSRWATVLHLSMHGLLEKGYVSFPGRTNHKLKDAIDLEKVLPQLSQRNDLLAHIPVFIEKCPLQLDIPVSATISPDFVFPLDLTTKSLFQIVTESEMSDGEHRRRFTEKILKPIVGLQPFVIAGNPGSLELLRNMGFRTFGSLIDESYDQIGDPAQRLDAVFQQINRLNDLPVISLRRDVEALNEILIHNFLHLMTVGPLLFNDAVEHRLRKLIAAQHSADDQELN